MVDRDKWEAPLYFGRPGALVQLPFPKGAFEPIYNRQVSDFVTGSGSHRVSKLLGGSRFWNLKWNALYYDTFAKLEAYANGHMGSGPWVLLDPSRGNLLTPNQSSATGERNATTGFLATNDPNCLLSSSFAAPHGINPRALRAGWAVAPGTATPVITLEPAYSPWFGVPVYPGLPYTFSSWFNRVTDPSINVAVKMLWRTSAGVDITETAGADTPVTAWTRLAVTGTAPGNAAFVRPMCVADGATISAPASLDLSEPQLEQQDSATTWKPGSGVYPVEILDMTEGVPGAAMWRTGVSLILREVVF